MPLVLSPVSILSPVFARLGASPRATWLSTSSRRPRCWTKLTGRSNPVLATRQWSSKAIWMWSVWLCGRIYWVHLVLGSVFSFKTIFPDAQGHFHSCPDLQMFRSCTTLVH